MPADAPVEGGPVPDVQADMSDEEAGPASPAPGEGQGPPRAARRRLNEQGPAAPGAARQEAAGAEQRAERRVFCPVPGCVAGDAARAPGWHTVQSMRPHLEEHTSGHLLGDVPDEWLEQHGLGQCVVCSRLLARRFGHACPRCRPSLARPAPPLQARPLAGGCPTLEEVCTTPCRVKRYVPKRAKHEWGQCLITALARTVETNDVASWTELLALPKMVLVAGGRGGKGHAKRLEAETKRRCRMWLEGHRSQLWSN